jgi:hypothetical protein
MGAASSLQASIAAVDRFLQAQRGVGGSGGGSSSSGSSGGGGGGRSSSGVDVLSTDVGVSLELRGQLVTTYHKFFSAGAGSAEALRQVASIYNTARAEGTPMVGLHKTRTMASVSSWQLPSSPQVFGVKRHATAGSLKPTTTTSLGHTSAFPFAAATSPTIAAAAASESAVASPFSGRPTHHGRARSSRLSNGGSSSDPAGGFSPPLRPAPLGFGAADFMSPQAGRRATGSGGGADGSHHFYQRSRGADEDFALTPVAVFNNSNSSNSNNTNHNDGKADDDADRAARSVLHADSSTTIGSTHVRNRSRSQSKTASTSTTPPGPASSAKPASPAVVLGKHSSSRKSGIPPLSSSTSADAVHDCKSPRPLSLASVLQTRRTTTTAAAAAATTATTTTDPATSSFGEGSPFVSNSSDTSLGRFVFLLCTDATSRGYAHLAHTDTDRPTDRHAHTHAHARTHPHTRTNARTMCTDTATTMHASGIVMVVLLSLVAAAVLLMVLVIVSSLPVSPAVRGTARPPHQHRVCREATPPR